MALVLDFVPRALAGAIPDPEAPQPRTYNVEVSVYPGGYLEFTASGVRADARSLSQIAGELEKIASIIHSDVMTMEEKRI